MCCFAIVTRQQRTKQMYKSNSNTNNQTTTSFFRGQKYVFSKKGQKEIHIMKYYSRSLQLLGHIWLPPERAYVTVSLSFVSKYLEHLAQSNCNKNGKQYVFYAKLKTLVSESIFKARAAEYLFIELRQYRNYSQCSQRLSFLQLVIMMRRGSIAKMTHMRDTFLIRCPFGVQRQKV